MKIQHVGRFMAPFHVDTASNRYIISPETLWHAPDGMEYLVEAMNQAGDWTCASWGSCFLMTLREATETAAELFSQDEAKLPVRVVRVGRWVGFNNSLLMVAVVKTFRVRKA